MNNSIKITLATCILLSAALTACNHGCSGFPNSNRTSKLKLNSAQLGSIDMLGEPADVAGKAMKLNAIPALNPDNVNITIGSQSLKTNSYVIGDNSSTASNSFANIKAGGGFGLFSASLAVEYAEEHKATNGGITLVSDGYINYPVSISIKVPKTKYLTAEALDYLNEEGEQAFYDEYGSGYVSEIKIGTKFNIIYTLSSNDVATKQALKVAAAASYGSFASFAASIGAMNEQQQQNIEKQIKIEVNGVTAQILNLPNCEIKDLNKCSTDLTNFVIGYLNNTIDKYDSLKKELNDPNKPTSLTKFFNVFSSSGVGDNSIFGLDSVNVSPYPNMDSTYESEKEELQQNIINKIAMSAMLSGDSSLISTLKNNEIVNNAVTASSDLKALIESVDTITVFNDSLISTSTMKNIVSACFSGKSVKSCNAYLNQANIIKGKDSTKLSITSYFQMLDKFNNKSVLKLQGYYSDVMPMQANIFWMKLKDANNSDILVPINLNDRTANRCRSILGSAEIATLDKYSGLKSSAAYQNFAGTIFKDIMDNKEVTEYIPMPDDLILYPTYDAKGDITSVRRSSIMFQNVKRNNKEFNGVFSCQQSQIWNPSLNKNVAITKCNDTFSDFTGLQFYNDNSTLIDAIATYRDKAIINRGYHIASKSNICLDVGSRDLTTEQPWCSTDNRKCLSLGVNGSISYTDSSQNYSKNYGKIQDNTRMISLSPKNGVGFWYYPVSNKDAVLVSTTIPTEKGIFPEGSIIDDNGIRFFFDNGNEQALRIAEIKKVLGAAVNDSIKKSCEITGINKDLVKELSSSSSTWTESNYNSLIVQFVCNGTPIKKRLFPGGVYDYYNSGITMTNWKDWEINEKVNPLIAKNASAFNAAIISDEFSSGRDYLRWESTWKHELINKLEEQGRESNFNSFIKETKGDVNWVIFLLNTPTKLPIPVKINYVGGGWNADVELSVWKKHGRMVSFPYGGNQSELSSYTLYNGYIPAENTLTNLYGVYHNESSIRISWSDSPL